jgi:hypothetical protein
LSRYLDDSSNGRANFPLRHCFLTTRYPQATTTYTRSTAIMRDILLAALVGAVAVSARHRNEMNGWRTMGHLPGRDWEHPRGMGNATFEQYIDHSNPDLGTFEQFYFYDTTYWKGPGECFLDDNSRKTPILTTYRLPSRPLHPRRGQRHWLHQLPQHQPYHWSHRREDRCRNNRPRAPLLGHFHTLHEPDDREPQIPHPGELHLRLDKLRQQGPPALRSPLAQ